MDAEDLQVLRDCSLWMSQRHSVLLVTVVRTWGSSPRPPGAMMAIRDDGRVTGSVSGGCIEDDLIADVRERSINGLTPQSLPAIVSYGISADEAHRFGLPCGGTLQLVLEPLSHVSRIDELVDRLNSRRLTCRALNLKTGTVELSDSDRGDQLELAEDLLQTVLGPRYRLLVIGGGQLSRYLCATAIGLGFEVTVCDPRTDYLDDHEFGPVSITRDMPDDAVQAFQPDAQTAIVALTHDPKLDDLALMDALKTPAFYVGALGSRLNNSNRRARMKEHFEMTDEELQRLDGPAGIYIGSRTPPEIALSILAAMVAAKNGVKLPDQAMVSSAKEAASMATPYAVCSV
ncbi:Carbon monoxide dehydrogenase F protein [Paraburkholderia piptadeniae]|uniref:Carbon monoxide dehydrogenase F protein n=1 Tax=Paraburkholderia piptadeniae TaxID=1701573 RepID=A0A1N7RW91_9BURK|nr:XdhC family protein [Paraburkholderia piptadeniae]SIT39361.1 Carbon monoxide dehydrogenase F protein [Paraburkholderia piptadeniae]